jgi:stage V sporulation protein AB
MIELAGRLFIVFIGLAGGIAVGSGMVAFLIVLDLIPRLAQLARAFRMSAWFESAVVSGSVFWSFADFFNWNLQLSSPLPLIGIGLMDGIFVGMLAGALTEVLNVIPILAKRLQLGDYLVGLVMAMVLGKIAGSLFDWLVFYW